MLSESTDITIRVPEGAILFSVLYNIYIDDTSEDGANIKSFTYTQDISSGSDWQPGGVDEEMKDQSAESQILAKNDLTQH